VSDIKSMVSKHCQLSLSRLTHLLNSDAFDDSSFSAHRNFLPGTETMSLHKVQDKVGQYQCAITQINYLFGNAILSSNRALLARHNLVTRQSTDDVIQDYLKNGYTAFVQEKPLAFNFVNGDYRWLATRVSLTYDLEETTAIASSMNNIRRLLSEQVTKDLLLLVTYKPMD
jgi:hypothetical protein